MYIFISKAVLRVMVQIKTRERGPLPSVSLPKIGYFLLLSNPPFLSVVVRLCTHMHVDYIPWLPVIAVDLVSFVSVLYHSSFLMVKLFGK